MANLKENRNIAKLIGFTETPYHCYVMKKYKCSLQHLIDNIGLEKNLETCTFIGNEISNGMKYIHSKGIIHLDLKPLNILIDEYDQGNYNFVICDFGSSSIIGDTPRALGFEAPERLEFTCRYTPPEVFQRMRINDSFSGRPSTENDKSIDVYAFAITMFEVITREKSYKGMTADQIIELILAGNRPDWPIDIRVNASYAALLELVQDCWAASPTSRPKFDQIQFIFNQNLQ